MESGSSNEARRAAAESAGREREMLQVLAAINNKLGILLLIEIAIVVVLVAAAIAGLLLLFGVGGAR